MTAVLKIIVLNVKFSTNVYDKTDDLGFQIVDFPRMDI